MPRSTIPNLQIFLNRLTARSFLNEEERQAILRVPTLPSRVEANHDLVRMGERVDHCFLIVEGMTGRVGQTSDGARQITALHVPGDVADLHSVVRPLVTSAIQALSTTTVLRLPVAELRQIAARFPAVAEAFWRECMVDAAVLSQWVVNMGCRDAKTRLAHLFCELAIRTSRDRTQHRTYPFPLTQTQLGDATGLTSVHVNRILKALRQEGLVQVKAREVRIVNWKGLAAVAEFDGNYLYGDTASDEKEVAGSMTGSSRAARPTASHQIKSDLVRRLVCGC